MLQEPLLVVGAFYILFFTVIIYVRLDFSITKVLYEESFANVNGLLRQWSEIFHASNSPQLFPLDI